MGNILNAEEMTIGDYLRLSDSKSNLNIPFSQRPYVWSHDEISRFWNDLINVLNKEEEQHILNFFTLYNEEKTKSSYIYDGQQRTITSVILLCALANVYNDFYQQTKIEDFKTAHNEIKEEYVVKKARFGSNKGNKNITIKFDSDDLNNFFETYIINGIDCEDIEDLKNETKINLINTYTYFKQNINKFIESYMTIEEKSDCLDEIVNSLISGFIIVELKTKNKSIAERMFNTLNTTGKDLDVFYIIKNECVTILGDIEVKPKWVDIEENLAGLPKDQFVTYFANVYNGKIKDSEAFDKINRSNMKDSKSTKTFIDNFLDASRWYSFCRNTTNDDIFNERDISATTISEMKNSIDILNNQQITSYIPVIFSMVLGRYNIDDIKDVLKRIESLMLRNKTVLGQSAQFFNNFYPNLAKKITTEHLQKDDILNEIKSVIASDKDVMEVLTKSFNKKSSTLRVILSEIMKIKYPEIIVKSDVTVVNLEHVVPKTVTEEWKIESGEDIENYIYYIGNLTLMSTPNNSGIRNSSFKQKKEIYKLSGIPMTTEIGNSEIEVWDKDIIIKRSKELASLFLDRWEI
ncbi:DUF262 domain-containing HNH endonuclease family protein [Paraclostridium tenue]|uniref:DUF262 domain-containing protein n=1 Tax=Paraclostridium tenue TaxID=1737 RepID=A0ABN1LZ99_9FIRM